MISRVESNTVFFIVSERSGANLLMNMVSSHKALYAPIPPHFFRHLLSNRARYGDLSIDENWEALIVDMLDFTQKIREPWPIRMNAQEIAQCVKARTIESAFEFFLEGERKRHDVDFLIVKENEFFRFLPAMLVLFPKARFVWQVRDPRDMMSSFKRSPLMSKLITSPISTWKLEQSQMINVWWYLNCAEQICAHRYEDLIQQPMVVLQRLCEFIGVEFDDSMLEYHQFEFAKNRAKSSDLRKNVANPVMSENYGKYKSELERYEIESIESEVGELMDIFGYEREFPPYVSKEEQLKDRKSVILDDSSTSREDRISRASRLDVIQRMLTRGKLSPFH